MGPEDVSGNGSRIEDLEALAKAELLKRLKDPAEARKLAATGLLNLVIVFEKQKPPEKPQDDSVDLDPLEVIAATDLPDDRKRELIEQELVKMDERRVALLGALEVSDGETDGVGGL